MLKIDEKTVFKEYNKCKGETECAQVSTIYKIKVVIKHYAVTNVIKMDCAFVETMTDSENSAALRNTKSRALQSFYRIQFSSVARCKV
jgi:hypothetical protein